MSDQANDVYLLSAARTPIGKMLGGLATMPATELGAVAIRVRCRARRWMPRSSTR